MVGACPVPDLLCRDAGGGRLHAPIGLRRDKIGAGGISDLVEYLMSLMPKGEKTEFQPEWCGGACDISGMKRSVESTARLAVEWQKRVTTARCPFIRSIWT
jgi:hypothetical protein